MSKVAVICAYNPRNSGMYSVDMAARSFFDASGLDYELCVTQDRTRIGALRYRLVRSIDDLQRYDTLVYWGDFLNNPMWGREDYAPREIKRHAVADLGAGFDNWRELYLPRARPWSIGSARVLAIGGSFIGMGPYLDSAIKADLQGFLARADTVVVRDPASLEELDRVVREAPNVHLGFDCASLTGPIAPTRFRGNYFAHSFGRSLSKAEARALVGRVECATGMRGVGVDWLSLRWPRRFTHAKFVTHLALIRHARFCLTDIYHFAINSMSQGTLPLCVLRDDSAAPSTLNEVKKHWLYRMARLDAALLTLKGNRQAALADQTVRDAAGVAAEAVARLTPSSAWREGFAECQRRLRRRLQSCFA